MTKVNEHVMRSLQLRLDWDRRISRKVGAELKSARDRLGWNRKTTAAQLRPTFTEKTVLSIEDGSRHLTVPQHVEVCRLLRADPAQVLTKALVQLDDLANFTDFTLHVNLVTIANDSTARFTAAQAWAHRRLTSYPTDTHILIGADAIKELAASFDCGYLELIDYLCGFVVNENGVSHDRDTSGRGQP